jgi:hypothetical protein
MNKSNQKEPIPWDHQGGTGMSASWTWNTPHFTVTIIGEGLGGKTMYNWKILDLSSGFPRPFDNGIEMSFQTATESLLETVAKSYARELGYYSYAGDLGTTFQLADGKRYNLAKAIGEEVVLEIDSDSLGLEIYTGVFDILNYDFVLTSGETSLIISPRSVKDVKKEMGMTSYVNNKYAVSGPTQSKNRRIVHEEWRRGCTGKPGYHPGTTVHGPGSDYCSMHGV